MKRLAITADDYGPHPFINRGTLEAAKEGLITSVGVLTNNYDSHHGPYDLKKEIGALVQAIDDKKIGIGVHLSISSGKPLVKNQQHRRKLKLENDFFQNISTFDFGRSRKHLAAMKEEIRAQILALKDILDTYNLPIDHISSHQGLLSLFSDYYYLMLDVLKEEGIKTTVRTPLPISKNSWYKKDFLGSVMKKEGEQRAIKLADNNLLLIPILANGILEENLRGKADDAIKDYGQKVPDYFFENFYGKPSNSELKRVIDHFPGSTGETHLGEFVVHLGRGHMGDVHLNGINSHYFKTRSSELNVLKAFKFEEYAKEKGVEFCSMLEL